MFTYFYDKFQVSLIFNRFMIDKKYQGKGFGSKSFNLLLNYIKTKYNPSSIELTTSNPKAIKLYLKHGFILANNKKAKEIYNNFKEHLLIYKEIVAEYSFSLKKIEIK